MTFDLAIAGGGPAGCAAAITAARAGARVLLLERGRFPRHKVCGEFVSAESFQTLQWLIPQNFGKLVSDAPRICNSRIFLDGVILRMPVTPAAFSIPRFDFDAALWNACLKKGVEALSQTTVRGVGGTGPFRIVAGTRTFEAAALINATGRWSNLTSPNTRVQAVREKWIGVKAHFYEFNAPGSVDLYFFEGGYCGVQPVAAESGRGTQINACAMVRAGVASTIEGVLCQSTTLKERSSQWKSAMEPVQTSPLFFHKPEPVQNAMLQVGDAATFVDPFIGDGISLALRSGVLAAECLTPFFRGECSLDAASARYCDEYARQFGHIFNASSRLRGVLRWPRAVRKPVLSALARAPFITRRIVQMTR